MSAGWRRDTVREHRAHRQAAPEPGDVLAVVPVLRADAVSVAGLRLHGRSLPSHALEAIHASGVRRVVLAGQQDDLDAVGFPGHWCSYPGGDPRLVSDSAGGLGRLLSDLLDRWPTAGAELLALHDPWCPLMPSSYLDDVLALARSEVGAVVVAYRPMTDTVKSLVGARIDTTVDRDRVRVLSSPLVLPVPLLQDLRSRGLLADCPDLVGLVDLVRAHGAHLLWSPAPVAGRRVSDAASLAVLECLTAAD